MIGKDDTAWWWGGYLIPTLRRRVRGQQGGRCCSRFGRNDVAFIFFLPVCVLIEKLSLSRMPFRGDAVISKCFSSVTDVAFSSRAPAN